MALSCIHPQDPSALHLQNMSTGDVIETIWAALYSSSKQSHTNIEHHLQTIALIRHILVRVGGPSEEAQQNMFNLGFSETEVLGLIGGLVTDADLLPQARIVPQKVMQQLLQSPAFSNVTVNLGFINNLIMSMNLILSPSDFVST